MGFGYTITCAIFATTGALIYGYDSGIISTTLAQKTFLPYLGNPSKDLTGAIVSTFSGGQMIGNLASGYLSDALGRKNTIWAVSTIALIGTAIQTGCVNVGMFLAGRIITGLALGVMFNVASIYNAEISPPNIRGVIVGMQAMLLAVGFALANFVGCLGAYNPGDAAWRVPLSLQCLFAIILIIGLFWLPESPRWLIQHGRNEQARLTLQKLHGGSTEFPDLPEREYNQIKKQIEFEREVVINSWWALFTKPSYRYRFWLGLGVQVSHFATGATAINYYQTILFRSIGITGHRTLWLSVGYGMMGVVGMTACLLYIDKLGRKVLLVMSAGAQAVIMTLIMVFFKYFAQSDNRVGQGFTVLWIFLMSISFSLGYTSLQVLYLAEIFPTALRARGTAICAFFGTGVGLMFSQVTPRAIEALEWKYFSIFMACDAAAALMFYFFYPETMGKTLEEMAEIFGDDLAFTDHIGAESIRGAAAGQDVELSAQKETGKHEGEIQHLDFQLKA